MKLFTTNQLITRLLLIVVTLVMAINPSAAQSGEQCASGNIHRKLMLTDSVYRMRTKENEVKLQNYMTRLNMNNGLVLASATTYTIPVVVHVIHTGGALGTN